MACLINFGISEAEASAGRIPIKSPRYLLPNSLVSCPLCPWDPGDLQPVAPHQKHSDYGAHEDSTLQKAPCCTAAPIQVLVFAHKNNTSKLNETRDASMKIDERPAPSK